VLKYGASPALAPAVGTPVGVPRKFVVSPSAHGTQTVLPSWSPHNALPVLPPVAVVVCAKPMGHAHAPGPLKPGSSVPCASAQQPTPDTLKPSDSPGGHCGDVDSADAASSSASARRHAARSRARARAARGGRRCGAVIRRQAARSEATPGQQHLIRSALYSFGSRTKEERASLPGLPLTTLLGVPGSTGASP
jgi:hypothetical protein